MPLSRERPTRVRLSAAWLCAAAGARLGPDDAVCYALAHVYKEAANRAQKFASISHDGSRAPAPGGAGHSGAAARREARCAAGRAAEKQCREVAESLP